MSDFLDKLKDGYGDFFGKTLNTGGQIIEGVGNNFENSANADKANIDRIAVNNAIALQKAKDDAERKKRMGDVMQIAVFGLLFIALIFAIGVVAPKIQKAFKQAG